MDQAPGPIIAKVAPRVAKMRGFQGSPAPEKTIQTSTPATTAPATGVHKPTRRSIPAPAPIICGTCETFDANCDVALNWETKQYTRAAAVANRCRKRPVPGQPSANVEAKRCRNTPVKTLDAYFKVAAMTEETAKGRAR